MDDENHYETWGSIACCFTHRLANKICSQAVDGLETKMKKTRITVSRESRTGLNTHFNVPGQGEVPRGALATQIERGDHPGYHVLRRQDGRRIPRSNPNGSKGDNLG